MPELPEVETIARGLRLRLPGRRIAGLACYCSSVLAQDAEIVRRRVTGRCFTAVLRHGKYLFLQLEGGSALAVHLRMTGQLYLAESGVEKDRHVHLEFTFAGASWRLVYRDVRKFGGFVLLEGMGIEEFLAGKHLGPDALRVRPEELLTACRRTRRQLKAVLLDQRVLAGLGNIYTDEVLHRSGLSPLLPAAGLTSGEAALLTATIQEVLKEAIRRKGTTLNDYRDAEQNRGGFQGFLRVYGREGEACTRCGGPIHKIRAAGRGTYFCPRCQKADHAT